MSEIREPVTHNLKICPEHYSAVCAGVKRAELRKNDRDYRAGDTLDLCEWDKDDESFTGNYISVTVTHVADVGEWMPGYVLLSIELVLRERAEPVAYMIGGHYLMHANDPKVDNYSSAVPLYTAPPAPVVTAETFEEWSRRCEIQLTLCRPEFREVAEITWNACRAAMLAAPPAPVTAGWIACSERMPEVGDIVLTADNGGVNVGEMEHSGASYRYFTSVVSGRELPATHWMPLPEAPTKN
ncbi:DUF3850 domain-containing protein [Cronobacter sakazakii]|uniref:DUF3850 domain-containing protein n=9 Tax=Cronobacter sakazakii TaxID=28141 RepID=UPI001EFDB360|nr:DUF3850 domain-containing protein [Cronobacter sakazakii]